MQNSNNKKGKVSKIQFAGLLDYWLWGFLSEKAVKKTAKGRKSRKHKSRKHKTRRKRHHKGHRRNKKTGRYYGGK